MKVNSCFGFSSACVHTHTHHKPFSITSQHIRKLKTKDIVINIKKLNCPCFESYSFSKLFGCWTVTAAKKKWVFLLQFLYLISTESDPYITQTMENSFLINLDYAAALLGISHTCRRHIVETLVACSFIGFSCIAHLSLPFTFLFDVMMTTGLSAA